MYLVFALWFSSPFQKAITDLRMKHYGRIVQVSLHFRSRNKGAAGPLAPLLVHFHAVFGEKIAN